MLKHGSLILWRHDGGNDNAGGTGEDMVEQVMRVVTNACDATMTKSKAGFQNPTSLLVDRGNSRTKEDV